MVSTFRKAILVPAKNIITDLFLTVAGQEEKVGGGGSIGYYCPAGDNRIYLNADDAPLPARPPCLSSQQQAQELLPWTILFP